MRKLVAVVSLMLAVSCGSKTPALSEAELIAYAKKIDVAKLDPSLQSQPLEDWLRVGPARVERLGWGINNCDDKPDYEEPRDGYPLCARINYFRGGVGGYLLITLGTTRKGIVDPPQLMYAFVSRRTTNGPQYQSVPKLSDLPRAIERLLEAEKQSSPGPG